MTTEAILKERARSFYVTGGTLRLDAPSYVVRQADQALLEGLQQGHLCYMLTSRQMGKSSLMVRTATRLREEGCHVTVIDLTEIGQNLTVEQWYYGLLRRLGEQIELEDDLIDFWRENKTLGPMQRWMAAIREVALKQLPGKIVIFIDEIDAVLSLGFSTDEFFAGIRESYNHRTQNSELERLVFCLLGVATPSDLIQDPRTTPFNIGQRIELSDFTFEEAVPLAKGLSANPGTGKHLLRRVLAWTGGQPYLTQRLCRALSEYGDALTTRDVDKQCDALFLSRKARETDDNLAFVRNRLLRSSPDIAALLDIYAQARNHWQAMHFDSTNPNMAILRLSGIVRVVNGRLYVRNRIYYRVFDREWIRTSMPDAELQRQRAAYRKGMLLTGSVAFFVIIAVGAVALKIKSEQKNAEKAAHNAQSEKKNAQYAQQLAETETGRAEENARRAGESARQASEAAEKLQKSSLALKEKSGEIERQRDEAKHEKMLAVKAGQKALLAEKRALAARDESNCLLYIASMNLAQRELDDLNIDHVREILHKEQNNPEAGFEWGYLQRQCDLSLNTIAAHQEFLTGMALSQDGKWLLTGSRDSTAKLWNTQTRRLKCVIKVDQPVSAIGLSPDGTHLAIGDSAGGLALWDADGQEQGPPTKQAEQVNALTYSPDGQEFASGCADGIVKLWEADNGKLLRTFPAPSHQAQPVVVAGLAFLANGRRLLIGMEDGTAQIWDSASGRKMVTLRGEKDSKLVCVAASPNGQWIALGYQDKTARIFDANTGEESMGFLPLQHKGFVLCMAFSPDSSLLATGSGKGVVRLWEVATHREQRLFTGHASRISGVAFSPDGMRLYSSSADGRVKIWNTAQDRQARVLKGHTQKVRTLAFSPDGNWLVTGSDDATARVWNAQAGTCTAVLQGHKATIEKVAFSPDGKRIATGSDDKNVRIWDAVSGQSLFTLPLHDSSFFAIAYSPDGKYLATAGENGYLRLWEPRSGKFLRTLVKMTASPSSMAFSPDSRSLLCGCLDSTATLYDVASGKPRLVLKQHTDHVSSVAFSPDGKMLATGSDDSTAILWNAATGAILHTLRDGVAVEGVAFSPDGKRLLTGDNDGHAKLWDTQRGQEVLMLNGHNTFVLCVAFSPDGKRIATGSADSTAKIWEGGRVESSAVPKKEQRHLTGKQKPALQARL